MLEINNLRISIADRTLVEIDHLTISAEERLGIVGESGSGKTLTVLSILGLLPTMMNVTGSITLAGQELLNKSENDLAKIRGRDIAMVFQDPGRSLNPTMKIGRQTGETLRLHSDLSKSEIQEKVIELMHAVQLQDPEKLASRYPHELSGGQQQRVMIAMAIACKPKLLIADEPTTALDVTVQQEVLKLLLQLSQESGMALIFVSHNLGVVQAVSERIAVMNAGKIVEIGETSQILNSPKAQYTRELIGSNPSIPGAEELNRLLSTHFPTVKGV
jgi:ABC-type dipeptide/oligopeptide/nickel transport system ATPase component